VSPYVLGQRLVSEAEPELDFLTWDHRMVVGVLDLLLGDPSASASVAVLPELEPGIPLEAIFVLEEGMKQIEKAISGAELRVDCPLIWLGLESSRP